MDKKTLITLSQFSQGVELIQLDNGGSLRIDMTNAEFQGSPQFGNSFLHKGEFKCTASLLVNQKWQDSNPDAVDNCITKGGLKSGDYLAQRLSNPTRAAKIAAARKRLGKALDNADKKTLLSLRLKQGLTQTQVAEKLKTAQPNITRWEKNPSSMSVDNMKRYAAAIGVAALEVAEVVLSAETTESANYESA